MWGLDVDDTQYHGSALKVNLELLLRQLKALTSIVADYDQQIEALAQSARYEKPVQALICYKGIKEIFALTMITAIGDIKRFPHPRQLVSWAGMDIREYSSGGNHHRFGITKQGNRYLRTACIERINAATEPRRLANRLGPDACTPIQTSSALPIVVYVD